MFGGPWYECQGPSVADVRKDVLNHLNIIKVGANIEFEAEKGKIIEDAIIKFIPDDRNDFGSWRGYKSFGIVKKIAKEIIQEVKIKYSLLIIEKKLLPYITYHLYNPNTGIIMKKISKSTLIGKPTS
tara:strand:+ start:516 stop:896 length:381 start_codon:yes stop_codon:yes gene_type:complete